MELLESGLRILLCCWACIPPPPGARLSRASTKPSVPLQDCFERVVSSASRDAEDRCVLCIWHPLGSA